MFVTCPKPCRAALKRPALGEPAKGAFSGFSRTVAKATGLSTFCVAGPSSRDAENENGL